MSQRRGIFYKSLKPVAVILLMLVINISTIVFLSNVDSKEFIFSRITYSSIGNQINHAFIQNIYRTRKKLHKNNKINKYVSIISFKSQPNYVKAISMEFHVYTSPFYKEAIFCFRFLRPPPAFLS